MRSFLRGDGAAPKGDITLAFELFDRYGRLRSELVTYPTIKRSGVWGRELDHGDILLIEAISVDQGYRRQNLAK